MEALLSYPCSPLISFPAQHEESSCPLWPNQLVFPHENAHIYDADPPADDRWPDHGFLATMDVVQEADDLLQDDFPGAKIIEDDNLAVTVQDDSLVMEDSGSLDDLLMAGATAVEAGDMVHASAILEKIDSIVLDGVACGRYGAVGSSSFDHLVCYFTSILRTRIARARTECHPLALASRLPAYQMLQELSPFIKFAHFTANQAILDATKGDSDVHVVDLNIGEGVQWPSLMSDLAGHGGRSFYLTAITTDADYSDDVQQASARRLSEFADSLKLPFQYNSLRIHSDEDLHDFSKSCNGPVIFSCDTTSMPYKSLGKLRTILPGCVKMLRPKLMVIVEEELVGIGKEASVCNTSFVDFFFEALHHYTMVFESLASCFSGGNHGLCLRLVERDMVGPRIQDFVEHYGPVTVEANVPGVLERYGACEMSASNVAQARMLVGLFNRGFGVVHEKGRLVLCWKSRPLTSVSVWAPI